MKRRVLHTIKLNAIAAVDRPCQEGARVAIIKRESDDMEKKEHDDAIAALKAEHKTEVDAINKKLADLADELAKAKLTPDEQACMDGMKPDAKKKFMELSADERAKQVTTFKSADETLTIGGTTIRKSVVGADSFAVMKAQQEQIVANKAAIDKANETAELATFEKRASTDYSHVGGADASMKAKILKAMAGAPEEVRKAFEAMMKAHEETAKKAFEKLGSSGKSTDEIQKGKAPFETKVAEIQKRDKTNRLDALDKATKEFPAEFEAYQEAGRA